MKHALLMVLACVMLVGLIGFTVASAAAQDKPSFAGTWKLPADAAPDMFAPPQMVVALDGNTMTVTGSSQMGDIKTVYSMDGTDARSPIEFNGQSFDRVTKTAWDGSKLVLTVKAEFNGQGFETKAVWSLGPDGTLLVETTRPDFQGGGGPVTTKASYKKS